MTADITTRLTEMYAHVEAERNALRRKLARGQARKRAYKDERDALLATVSQLQDDLAWAMPALGPRRKYGISSCKLVRHCLTGEPLNNSERPYDHYDLIGVTRTAANAPEHRREQAQAALLRFREMLEPEYVAKAGEALAALSVSSPAAPKEPR